MASRLTINTELGHSSWTGLNRGEIGLRRHCAGSPGRGRGRQTPAQRLDRPGFSASPTARLRSRGRTTPAGAGNYLATSGDSCGPPRVLVVS